MYFTGRMARIMNSGPDWQLAVLDKVGGAEASTPTGAAATEAPAAAETAPTETAATEPPAAPA